MAKVQQKSEKITAFGGIFFVLDKFDSILSSVIDSHLGLRNIHGGRFFRYHSTITKEPSLCYEIYITRSARASLVRDRVSRQSR